MNCCFIKKKRVIPQIYETHVKKEEEGTKRNSSNKFLDERIPCGTCHKIFSLQQNELSALCGGCNQFLHCGIAGKCVGPNCGNSFHRLSWCKKCVPKTVIINLQDLGPDKDCLCQECLDDPTTPSCYKKNI